MAGTRRHGLGVVPLAKVITTIFLTPVLLAVACEAAAPQNLAPPATLAVASPQKPPYEPTVAIGAAPFCHPSYQGACLDRNASDYDCVGGSGDGPLYTGRVRVVGPDVFGLDRDGDGIGCQSSR